MNARCSRIALLGHAIPDPTWSAADSLPAALDRVCPRQEWSRAVLRVGQDGGHEVAGRAVRSGMSRIFTTSFASVYPHYVTKVMKKGRIKAELDQVIDGDRLRRDNVE